jgi:antitoxin (DNA-binding transcriptional repressor) of toxin-antitoxin stability system
MDPPGLAKKGRPVAGEEGLDRRRKRDRRRLAKVTARAKDQADDAVRTLGRYARRESCPT